MGPYNNNYSIIKTNAIFNYKEVDILRGFVTEQGKILPRRSTGLTAKQQRQLTKAIKQARILALMPFLNKD